MSNPPTEDSANFVKKWYNWFVDWASFLLKHTLVSLCLNAMIYAEFQKSNYLHIVSFFAYIAAHLAMFQYFFTGGSLAQARLPMAPKVSKRSPTLTCKLNCVSDQDGASHLQESQVPSMEKAFTVKVNHDLIVSIKEMKALLWAMNQRLCASQKFKHRTRNDSNEIEECKDLYFSERTPKIEIPSLDKRSPKRQKYGSFNGVDSVGWDE